MTRSDCKRQGMPQTLRHPLRRAHVRLALTSLLLTAFAAHASTGIEEDIRCLSTSGPKKIQLEWRTFSDSRAGWFGGYVRYKGASRTLPIVLASTTTVSSPEGRPSEFRYTWLEVSDGRVTGEYGLSSQGARVYDFSYKNLRNAQKFAFTELDLPGEDGKCQWE